MKVVFYVLECLDFQYLQTCRTPNIDYLNPHPALSFGATTSAAIPALLTGYLPTCTVDANCPHNTIPEELLPRDPYFLKKHFKENVYLYIPNGWVWGLIGSLLKPMMPKLKKWWESFNTAEMVDDFIKLHKGGNFFAYFHVMETHPPFLEGRKKVEFGSEEWLKRRKKGVELADESLKPLLGLDLDLLVVCSDHNLRHDVSSASALNTFIGTKYRG